MSDNVTQSNKVPRWPCRRTIWCNNNYYVGQLLSNDVFRSIQRMREKKEKGSSEKAGTSRSRARSKDLQVWLIDWHNMRYVLRFQPRRKTSFRILGPNNAFCLRSRNQRTSSRTLSRSSSYIPTLYTIYVCRASICYVRLFIHRRKGLFKLIFRNRRLWRSIISQSMRSLGKDANKRKISFSFLSLFLISSY